MNIKMLLIVGLVISANNARSMEGYDKQDTEEINKNQVIEINQTQATKFSIKDSVVTIFNNSTNKVSKMTGFKNITQESEKDYKNNVEKISSIQSSEQFIFDWSNNSVLSSNPSYLKKGLDREYDYQYQVVKNLYEMQKNNSFDVQKLQDIQKFFARSEAYHTAISELCKNQLQLIENNINEALQKNNENNNK